MVKPSFHQKKSPKKKREDPTKHKKTQKEKYELKLKFKKDYCTCGNVAFNNAHCDQHPTLTSFFRKFQQTKKVDTVPDTYESI